MSFPVVQQSVLRALAEGRVGATVRGKWTIERLLDVGGMAAVYAATHRNGNRVAIKVLHAAYAENHQAKERFLREGYVANKVGHSGAVSVLDDDELDDGTPFIVMELLEGQSLEDRLKVQKTMGHAAVMYIADQLLDVLAAAHEKNIIHRDIKPPNVFLTNDGHAKVLDFGLARLRESAFGGTMTRTGMVIGTASYMPPEQARGKHNLVDHRTDIWALGATMFKALTGRYVHEGGTVNERLIKAMTDHAPRLESVLPDVPTPLGDLVDRTLMFQKADRWANARTMQTALRMAYEKIEHAPLPSVARLSLPATDGSPPSDKGADEDVHFSVVFSDDQAGGDSIVIEFEDATGPSERVVLRRRADRTADGDDEISEVSVVEYQEHDSTKPPGRA